MSSRENRNRNNNTFRVFRDFRGKKPSKTTAAKPTHEQKFYPMWLGSTKMNIQKCIHVTHKPHPKTWGGPECNSGRAQRAGNGQGNHTTI
ncbi:hypothetical protein [uncultured Gimesia sp.]|uniref:hypothetical protein n=1 Tax=uncultured Gimesia sp. TaxID=1678688 RepID=UPI002617598A|nr:hypothetical protein [uncultured Gimesia sp.]